MKQSNQPHSSNQPQSSDLRTQPRRRLRALAATGAVLTAAASAVVGGAGPAGAAIHQCGISGDRTNCAYVTGIDAGSHLAVRTGPSYGAAKSPVFGQYHNGDQLGLICWTTGDPDADGNGYRYWMRVDNGIGDGYVNDWYLDTGGPGTWKSQLPQC
ncbi:hypothetical protein FHS35_001181 [Streptomyces umbrinus]|uniref:hypothetical protein n=1 Tax=Streptomyces umbrinus TaxID=67370 RepID=UPI00167CD4EC|nr:hypothetical protein [Streptomyces umbrinus]MCR3724333.1 hypothetical protein [Streptomyces umbrinus]GHH51887.1 hypothetical protein GCM10018775_51440 [Streptomyces umbrinus]